jgi:hypothetical protein
MTSIVSDQIKFDVLIAIQIRKIIKNLNTNIYIDEYPIPSLALQPHSPLF